MEPEARQHLRRPVPGAFTLVVLLLVIAIVVSLAAQLLPSLASAPEKARGAVSRIGLSQIGVEMLD
ncbi:MAG: type II secretion system protein [Verrucomicrobiota bacterium]